jgi:hypothetical protein
MLRSLAGAQARADDAVDVVTWDISPLLEASLLGRPKGLSSSAEPGTGPVAAIRIVPRVPLDPASAVHPAALATSLVSWRGTVTGGHDLFGTELAPLDLDAVRDCAQRAMAAGLTTLAITATGAGACAKHEETAAARLLEEFPALRLCLSHEAGGLGLLEREATTVVNAALLDVVEDLIERCERVTSRAVPGATCWFAGGDGGRVQAKRLRWLPVLGLSASTATALMGAAALASRSNVVVALVSASGVSIGRIEDGLPHVEADLPGKLAVQMTLPQAAVAVHPVATASADAWLTEQNAHLIDVVAALDEDATVPAHQILQATGRGTILIRADADLAAFGAACTEPGAWLDLLAPVVAPEELDRVQSQAEHRALTLAATDGSTPGTERIVKSIASPVGYLSIYRLQVRATSCTATGAE